MGGVGRRALPIGVHGAAGTGHRLAPRPARFAAGPPPGTGLPPHT